MRNSIQGPLLRTGNNSSFKALGETGYPVFRMAFQLREAIYRLDAGRDLARHLAIPQNDQGGDRTDWYSSFAGDVIPWSSASEQERASARQQFAEFQTSVQALSEQMLNAENSGAGGDRRVFALLLKSVVNFPDDEYLYLVNGVLVITFWGFVHPNSEQHNPMHWLQPGSVPVQESMAAGALSQSLSTPAQSIETPGTLTHIRRKPARWNWRWLLWLLLALLFLALILGLLRGCVPSLSLPDLPHLSQPNSTTDNGTTVGHQISASSDRDYSTTSGVEVTATPDVASGTLGRIATGTAQKNIDHSADSAVVTAPDTASDATTQKREAEADTEAELSAATAPAAELPVSEPQHPGDVYPGAPTVTPAAGEPLTLPAQLPDGPAQFLNGKWRVNGGIQDKLTGRPLQLQYDFWHGNGTVSVRQSDGVICKGQAQGRVIQGALSITNPEQMKCSDNSDFIGPTIECKSATAGHTNCVGNNAGDKTFPIRMLQPHS